MEMEPFEWGNLPLELREMCVRKLDFATSMKLRRASRSDKRIVESPHNRIKFDQLVYAERYEGIQVRLYNGKKRIERSRNEGKVESLLMSALKYSKIRQLKLTGFEKDETKVFDKMAAVGAVFKELWLDHLSDTNFHLALENFGEGVEFFELAQDTAPSKKSLERVLRDSLIIPRFLNAKHIQICPSGLDHFIPPAPFHTLIELWIQNDKALGSKLIVFVDSYVTDDDDVYDPGNAGKEECALFREKFADRVVLHNEDEKEIRITTNNPENQILFRIITDKHTSSEPDDVLYTVTMVFQVIPTTLEKKDYEKTAGYIVLSW